MAIPSQQFITVYGAPSRGKYLHCNALFAVWWWLLTSKYLQQFYWLSKVKWRTNECNVHSVIQTNASLVSFSTRWVPHPVAPDSFLWAVVEQEVRGDSAVAVAVAVTLPYTAHAHATPAQITAQVSQASQDGCSSASREVLPGIVWRPVLLIILKDT